MGEALIYRCNRCGRNFTGINQGIFAAGMIDATFCGVKCLVAWGEAYLESVERAMLTAFQEVEHGGSG